METHLDLPNDAGAWQAAHASVANGTPVATVASALLEHLTQAERCSMLDGNAPFWAGIDDLAKGGYHRRPFVAARVERLGIPGFAFTDGPRGVVVGGATAFPVPIARGATFDPGLEAEVGSAIGTEVKAVGANLFGGVCVNLLRHLRWGRAQETYGEDPLLLGVMGAAAISGVQRHVMATVKHLALNSMENARFEVDVKVDPATLHETYLPHFRAAVDAQVACVMSAYNSVNGTWCGQSPLLLDEVLRQRFGFEGFVISDWIFGLRDGVASLEAGLDVEMPYAMIRREPIARALEAGTLAPALIDRSCRRILETLLRFGITEPTVTPEAVATDDHRRLARTVAARSFVLLKNGTTEDRLLPVAPATKVALLGRLGLVANLGDGGSSEVYAPDVVTFAEGLAEVFPSLTTCDGGDLDEARQLAQAAELVVVVVGSTKADEGEYLGSTSTPALNALLPGPDAPELVAAFDDYRARVDHVPPAGYGDEAMGTHVGGDRRSLELSAEDLALIEAARSVSDQVLVVVMGATAALLQEVASEVAGVLLVFYPGTEGGRALADVLVGAAEPAGRLPFALPVRAEDLVDFDPSATKVTYGPLHGQWHLDASFTQAAFPFGFGLGFGPVQMVSCAIEDSVVTVELENPGPFDTNTVAFLHVRPATQQRPFRLGGFTRVLVPAGGSASVTLGYDRSVLDRFDPSTGQLVGFTGTVQVEVGRWARDPEAVVLVD